MSKIYTPSPHTSTHVMTGPPSMLGVHIHQASPPTILKLCYGNADSIHELRRPRMHSRRYWRLCAIVAAHSHLPTFQSDPPRISSQLQLGCTFAVLGGSSIGALAWPRLDVRRSYSHGKMTWRSSMQHHSFGACASTTAFLQLAHVFPSVAKTAIPTMNQRSRLPWLAILG